jgi:hypothetical protein
MEFNPKVGADAQSAIPIARDKWIYGSLPSTALASTRAVEGNRPYLSIEHRV